MKFFAFIVLSATLATSGAFARCNSAPIFYPNLVEDESFSQLSKVSKERYLRDFYSDFCKIPSIVRSFLANEGMEIYITAGPITLNPYLAENWKGVRPRNHAGGTYDDLPGVSANDGKLVVLNLLSLDKGHGAASLVIHEVAHSLDYLYGSKKASKERDFKKISKSTPWNQFYQEGKILDPERDIPKSFKTETAILDYKKFIEKQNEDVRINTKERVRYHKKNKEEHFAELFGMWVLGGEHRQKIKVQIPLYERYFNYLLSQINEIELKRIFTDPNNSL